MVASARLGGARLLADRCASEQHASEQLRLTPDARIIQHLEESERGGQLERAMMKDLPFPVIREQYCLRYTPHIYLIKVTLLNSERILGCGKDI